MRCQKLLATSLPQSFPCARSSSKNLTSPMGHVSSSRWCPVARSAREVSTSNSKDRQVRNSLQMSSENGGTNIPSNLNGGLRGDGLIHPGSHFAVTRVTILGSRLQDTGACESVTTLDAIECSPMALPVRIYLLPLHKRLAGVVPTSLNRNTKAGTVRADTSSWREPVSISNLDSLVN